MVYVPVDKTIVLQNPLLRNVTLRNRASHAETTSQRHPESKNSRFRSEDLDAILRTRQWPSYHQLPSGKHTKNY